MAAHPSTSSPPEIDVAFFIDNIAPVVILRRTMSWSMCANNGIDWGIVVRAEGRRAASELGLRDLDVTDTAMCLAAAVIARQARDIRPPAPAMVAGDVLTQGKFVPMDGLHLFDWAITTAARQRMDDVMAGGAAGALVRLGALTPGAHTTMPGDICNELVLARAQEGLMEEWRQALQWAPPRAVPADDGAPAHRPDEGSTLAIVSMHVRPRRMLKAWTPEPGFAWCDECGAAPAHFQPVLHLPSCSRADSGPVYKTCRRCQHQRHRPLPGERETGTGGVCDCSCHWKLEER